MSLVFEKVQSLVYQHGITEVLEALALVTYDVERVWNKSAGSEHFVTQAWAELQVNLESALAQFSEEAK